MYTQIQRQKNAPIVVRPHPLNIYVYTDGVILTLMSDQRGMCIWILKEAVFVAPWQSCICQVASAGNSCNCWKTQPKNRRHSIYKIRNFLRPTPIFGSGTRGLSMKGAWGLSISKFKITSDN